MGDFLEMVKISAIFFLSEPDLGTSNISVREPDTFVSKPAAPPCEEVIFVLERSYITTAMRKSMLDLPVPGNF